MALTKGQYGIVEDRRSPEPKTKYYYFSDDVNTKYGSGPRIYSEGWHVNSMLSVFNYLGTGLYGQFNFVREFTMQEKLRISEYLVIYGH